MSTLITYTQPQTLSIMSNNVKEGNRNLSILNGLLKNAIMTNNKNLIKAALKGFIKNLRQTKHYKEYMLSKKHLELTVIREILTQPKLLMYSIEVNSTDGFLYLLKEFKITYKDSLFETNEGIKKAFKYVNLYGNIAIMKEIFKFYPKFYVEILMTQLDGNRKGVASWITMNCI